MQKNKSLSLAVGGALLLVSIFVEPLFLFLAFGAAVMLALLISVSKLVQLRVMLWLVMLSGVLDVFLHFPAFVWLWAFFSDAVRLTTADAMRRGMIHSAENEVPLLQFLVAAITFSVAVGMVMLIAVFVGLLLKWKFRRFLKLRP